MIENTRDSFASKIKGINIDLQKYDHMESENCTAESFPNKESNSIKNREPKHVQASTSPHTTVNDMSLSSLDLLTPIIALSDISNCRKQKFRKKTTTDCLIEREKVAQSASLGDFLEALSGQNCTAESFPNKESNSKKNREPKHVQASTSPHTTVNDLSLSSLDLLTPVIALSDISNCRKQKFRKKQPQITKWEKVAQSTASLGDFLEALSGEKCTPSSNNVHCELPSKKRLDTHGDKENAKVSATAGSQHYQEL